MRIIFTLIFCLIYGSLFSKENTPLTFSPWQEVVVSVSDLDRTASFFKNIGNFDLLHRANVSKSALVHYGLSDRDSAEEMLLKEKNSTHGFVRLINFHSSKGKMPMRPGARAWDTGCFFSIMIRMKGMDQIYKEAIKLGWWTETPIINYSAFGSNLNIVVFKGPDGLQVSAYERLSPPLPEEFKNLDIFSQPFNIMQTVNNAEVTKEFYSNILGFKTWYDGEAYVSKEKVMHPLGIPYSLTTKTRYKAKILSPIEGEFGRVEMVEFMDLEGIDYSNKCAAPNLGILSIKFPVENIQQTKKIILNRKPDLKVKIESIKIKPYGNVEIITVKTPDGSSVQFYK